MITITENLPIQPTGWLCPKCNGAHSPIVQSCPMGQFPTFPPPPFPAPVYPYSPPGIDQNAQYPFSITPTWISTTTNKMSSGGALHDQPGDIMYNGSENHNSWGDK